jgi:hypothetical protein
VPDAPSTRPRAVTWWEDLPFAVQAAVVMPGAILLLWGVHVWFLGQPLGRGLVYGVFWGLLVGGLVLGSTRAERARRRARAGDEAHPLPGGEPLRRSPPGDGDRRR